MYILPMCQHHDQHTVPQGVAARCWKWCWLVVCLFPLMAAAAPSPIQVPPSPMQLLADMSRASHQLSYAGRFVYSRNSHLSGLSILHVNDKQGIRVRLAYLDGRAAELLHIAGKLFYVHPDSKVTQLPAGGSLIPFTLSKRFAQHLPDYYQASVEGPGRVAGRHAWRVAVTPTDRWRYGYRLWLDQDSHLLLKSQVRGAAGQILEQIEFTSLTLNPKYAHNSFSLPKGASVMPPPHHVPPRGQQPAFRITAGWLPRGFKRMTLTHAVADNALKAHTYSDGLAAFTLFVVPTERPLSLGRLGSTQVLSRTFDLGEKSFRVMLMGELPVAAAKRILAAVELTPAP